MEQMLFPAWFINLFFLWCSPLHASRASDVQNNVFDEFSEVFSLSSLPNYVIANVSNLQAVRETSIRRKAPLHTFPLTEQDRIDIKILETKFDYEKDCVGLAAPQIGISKRFIVFKVDKEEGVTQGFPKNIWINPVYEKDGDETELVYEQCFSVVGVTAPVRRPKYIHYKATALNGTLIVGRAEGFAARVIQHETDHLDGILFIDLVPPNKIITIKEFRRRLKKFEEEEERKAKAK